MITKHTSIKIINFLQGASYGFILIGTLVFFKSFLFLGIATALFFSLIFIFVSIFMVLLLDVIKLQYIKLDELKKQSELLEKLVSNKFDDVEKLPN